MSRQNKKTAKRMAQLETKVERLVAVIEKWREESQAQAIYGRPWKLLAKCADELKWL
jgi:hypothetical protein